MTKPEEIKKKIKSLIKNLKKYDGLKYSREHDTELENVRRKFVLIGRAAVPELIEMLNNYDTWSCYHAAWALGELGDESAITPLVSALEEEDLGDEVQKALIKFGTACIPEVIKKVEYRIANPVKEGRGADHITMNALSTIGEIRCDESNEFLTKLLDDYMSEMPDHTFDPSKYDWKYINVDFFHLLDSMVRQQDKRAIPHIRKARDFFPDNYADYKICQIAMGRIKKGKVEGYLPLEVLDIAMPMGALMDMFSGGKLGHKDTFDDEYGEYFEDDDDEESEIVEKTIKKKSKSKSSKKSKTKAKSEKK